MVKKKQKLIILHKLVYLRNWFAYLMFFSTFFVCIYDTGFICYQCSVGIVSLQMRKKLCSAVSEAFFYTSVKRGLWEGEKIGFRLR